MDLDGVMAGQWLLSCWSKGIMVKAQGEGILTSSQPLGLPFDPYIL